MFVCVCVFQVGLQVGNVERDKEMKQEQEKLEKRIGLLNYLVDKDSKLSIQLVFWHDNNCYVCTCYLHVRIAYVITLH